MSSPGGALNAGGVIDITGEPKPTTSGLNASPAAVPSGQHEGTPERETDEALALLAQSVATPPSATPAAASDPGEPSAAAAVVQSQQVDPQSGGNLCAHALLVQSAATPPSAMPAAAGDPAEPSAAAPACDPAEPSAAAAVVQPQQVDPQSGGEFYAHAAEKPNPPENPAVRLGGWAGIGDI